MIRTALLLLALWAPIPASGQEPEPAVEPEPGAGEPLLGAPSTLALETGPEELVWIEAGTRLRREPDLRSPSIEILVERLQLPLIERRAGWVRVRYGTWTGWVRADGEALEPPPPATLISLAADRARLARLRELLGPARRLVSLGPYACHTDVEDRALLEHLAQGLEGLADAYRARYGIDPGPERDEVIVLFAGESGYRAFEREEPSLAGADTYGHSSLGLAVTFVGERQPEEVRKIVVHELTHLLNRRALGLELPPWLEEGLAEDLALRRLATAAGGRARSLGGGRSREAGLASRRGGGLEVVRFSGAQGSLIGLLREWNEPARLPLAKLVRAPRERFLDPQRRELLYAESAFFLRFLLEGGRRRHAAPLRAHLEAFARGQPAGAEELWARLGAGPAELESELALWLWNLARAYDLPAPFPRPR